MFSYIFFSVPLTRMKVLIYLISTHFTTFPRYSILKLKPQSTTQDSRFPYLIRRTPLLVRKFKGLVAEIPSSLIKKKIDFENG